MLYNYYYVQREANFNLKEYKLSKIISLEDTLIANCQHCLWTKILWRDTYLGSPANPCHKHSTDDGWHSGGRRRLAVGTRPSLAVFSSGLTARGLATRKSLVGLLPDPSSIVLGGRSMHRSWLTHLGGHCSPVPQMWSVASTSMLILSHTRAHLAHYGTLERPHLWKQPNPQ